MKKPNYYDNIAQIYDQTRWLTESVAEDIADFILALVCATPETSFLEPGVGTGLNVLPLVRRGYSVTGIDVSLEMLGQFRQKLNITPPNLKLIHAGMNPEDAHKEHKSETSEQQVRLSIYKLQI